MIINSSLFSEVSYEPDGRLLTMMWKKESNQLDEHGVKSEISLIIRYIQEYKIRNVIVDARDYAFRSNANLQTWMTRTYMPQIMESSVEKYAIIVEPGLLDEVKDSDPEDGVSPMVDYFTDLADAKQWITG